MNGFLNAFLLQIRKIPDCDWLARSMGVNYIFILAQLCSSSSRFVDRNTVPQELTLPDRERK